MGSEGLSKGSRVALITDHFAIAHVKRKLKGYSGIRQGYTLSHLFEYDHDLRTPRGVGFTFYISGVTNPADDLSWNFGVRNGRNNLQLIIANANHLKLPPIKATLSLFCKETGEAEITENRITSYPREARPKQTQKAHYGGRTASSHRKSK